MTETPDSSTDSKSAFAAKLNSHQTEGLVARRYECEFGPAEDVRRQLSELWLRIHATWVFLHDGLQFQSSELAIEIDDRTDADELNVRMLLKDRREDVCDEVDAFLDRPPSHENKQVCVRIDGEVGPLLSLLPQVTAGSFEGGIDGDDLLCFRCFVPGLGIARVRIRQFSDVLQRPEDRVAGVRSGAVFVRNANCSEASLVDSQIA